MIIPGLDGFQVLAKFKADPELRKLSIIMLSALDEENGIARCIEMGADDYLAKPFNPVFLRARIGACLEKKRLHDQERQTHEALVRSQKQLAAELAEAAAYVRSLLPPLLTSPVQTDWSFHPSQQLGGDSFGYHWLDGKRLAIYLLDVSGHGVGAALLSVSALNAIRSHSLPGADFNQPPEVLRALNRAFPMERNNNLFFTVWYGVLNLAQREITFGSAGHPPALLLPLPGSDPELRSLRTEAPAIGFFDDFEYPCAREPVQPGSRLFVFSDGAFELYQGQDQVGSLQQFLEDMQSAEVRELSPAARLGRALKLRGADTLEDDFSFLEIRTPKSG
jgi:sigma-B regulation protein RsbU (phosphoserine phosphatase)